MIQKVKARSTTSKLVFLTGIGRSGTTLLQMLLNAHPMVSFPPETHFFKNYFIPFLLKGSLPTTETLEKDQYLSRLSQESYQAAIESNIRDLEDLKKCFLNFLGDGKNLVVGDKDTEYVRYLRQVAKVFPQSYLINIIRDPRDVVASRLKTSWGSKRSLVFHAGEYQYYLKKVERDGQQYFGSRFIQVKYESLIEDAPRALNSVLSLLDLEYDPQMLEFQKNSQQLIASDEAAWKNNLDKPLMSSNKEKWKESLSSNEAALIQDGIEDFMHRQEYSLVEATPSKLLLIKKQLIQMLFRAKTFKERS